MLKKASNNKVFGVVLSERNYSYLSLFCLAKGQTKARVIRNVLENWEEKSNKHCSEAYLIQSIASKLKLDNPEPAILKEYKAEIKRDLIQRGLPAGHIDQILKLL